jgi:hypothetical protein
MNNKNIGWFNLFLSYFVFAFIYSGIIWFLWNFLFYPFFNINFTYLQTLAIYTITRLLFGNTSTNYISNFYSQKPMDLDKIDSYIKDFQDQLDRDAEEIEKKYEDLDKKN